ncbi:MAG TPA: FecR domain-containing protein, partial [Bryobacteraceae bacterium]
YIREGRESEPKRVVVKRFSPGWVAAAAVVIVLLGAGWWFMTRRAGVDAAVSRAPFLPAAGDSHPVTMILGDGRVMYPEAFRVGERIAGDGGMTITRTANGVAYSIDAGGARDENPVTHNIHIGRGRTGSFQIRFVDGSRVLLDTDTRFAYSVGLRTGPEPVVEGQAFFSIAHNDPSHPLKIWTGKGESVTVLGTSFNVRSYPGEVRGTVDLYSGRLRVDRMELRKMAGPDDIPAWTRPPAKSPYFEFQNTPLPEALQEVAAWYGKDVFNPGDIQGVRVTGKLPRGETLEHTLGALQLVQGRHAVLKSSEDTILVAAGD